MEIRKIQPFKTRYTSVSMLKNNVCTAIKIVVMST